MSRGFIQIPILIAIIIGLAALGGGSYIVAQKVSGPAEIATDIILPAETSSVQTISTTTNETKDEIRDSVIESLQKEVANLTEKANQASSATNSAGDVVEAEVVSTTANAFLCSKFNALTEEIFGIALQLIDTYEDDGMEENPSKGDFDYPYNKTNLQKTTFYNNVDRLNQKTDFLDTYDGISQAKTDLSKAADGFRVAFDLKLQGYKLANNDAFVYVSGYKILPQNNIDQAKLNINQASAKFTSALDYLSAGRNLLNAVKKDNSCN